MKINIECFIQGVEEVEIDLGYTPEEWDELTEEEQDEIITESISTAERIASDRVGHECVMQNYEIE